MKYIQWALALFLCSSSLLFSEINSNGDFQVWIFDSINTSISEKNTFYVESEVRFGDDSSELYVAYFQTLLKHEFTPNFSVAPGYRHLWSKGRSSAEFRVTYNPLIDAIIKAESSRLIIYDRSRIQYIIFDNLKNAWLYRNRIYVTTKKDFGKMKAKPFVSEELFFLERVGFQENRLNFGLSWGMDDLTPNIYYMVRHRKDLVRNWEYQNILGLSLFIKF